MKGLDQLEMLSITNLSLTMDYNYGFLVTVAHALSTLQTADFRQCAIYDTEDAKLIFERNKYIKVKILK